jgi:hypothetical protein
MVAETGVKDVEMHFKKKLRQITWRKKQKLIPKKVY